MAWLTATEIRNKFNIASNAFTNQITSAVNTAALIIREATSAEIYSEATGTALDDGDEYYVRQSKVIQSHAYLTFYFLLKDAGNKLTDSGVLEQFQANSSPGTQQVHMNKVLAPEKVEVMMANALSDAKLFLGSYGTITIDEETIIETPKVDLVSTLKWF